MAGIGSRLPEDAVARMRFFVPQAPPAFRRRFEVGALRCVPFKSLAITSIQPVFSRISYRPPKPRRLTQRGSGRLRTPSKNGSLRGGSKISGRSGWVANLKLIRPNVPRTAACVSGAECHYMVYGIVLWISSIAA